MSFFSRPSASIPDGTVAIAAVASLLLAGIWIFTVDRGRSEQREATAAEFSKNANLALALDVHTNRLLQGIDHFLILMRDQYQGPASRTPIPLDRLVAPAFAGSPWITFVGVTNERGDIVDALQPFQPTNITDRDFFQRQQRGEAPALLISEPALGRVSGRWAITLTRRISKPDGGFGGIVAISIEPRYLTELFETTNLGPDDVMSLVLTSGVTLARRRGAALEFGENISRSQLIAEHARQPTGTYTGPGGVDSQVRMFNYRRMKDYPVIATIGTLEADVLAPVRRRAQRSELAAWAATLFVGLVSAASIVMLGRQQRANRRLHEQASLLDKAQDAIIVTDLDRRITYWNKSAERLYGWTSAEAVGRTVTELFYGGGSGGPDEANEAYGAVMTSGEWTGELRRVNKVARPVIVESRFTLVRDAQGRPQSVLSINTDVSERRQLEQQFYRAQRLESIGTMAGGIAHDLNNVLTPIMMAIELLKDSVTTPADQEVLATIGASASRGAEMVRQVLSYARGFEGRRVEIEPGTLVADVARIARDTLPKTIDIRTGVEPGLPTLLGDPTQCHQVLLNLCVNARDAMPAGGQLTITATLARLDELSGVGLAPGAYVRLDVQDTGTGIAPEIADKIFDPFFTTKEPGKGTGLGLSTSMAIVKSHGGQIHVASPGGRGATFAIYLPAGAGPAPGLVADDASPAPQGRGQTVLVVDDEEAIRMIAQRTLERVGYRVLLATDGAEAVATFGAHHQAIAAVLLDMTMPVLAGVPAIQAMARISSHVPIVAMSGIAANEAPARAASEQVKAFLPKPFTTKTLLEVLNQVLA